MKKSKIDVKMLCDYCGKEQDYDKKQSNENWKIYPANEKCKCGGTFKLTVI